MAVDKRKVTISDVTLREYGQNVAKRNLNVFTDAYRAQTARNLIDLGFRRLEVLSCVSSKVVPSMHGDRLRGVAYMIGRQPGAEIVTLVPNTRGMQLFLSLKLHELGHHAGFFLSAVQEHNLANLGMTIKQTKQEYIKAADMAKKHDVRFCAYISAAFGYKPAGGQKIIEAGFESLMELITYFLELGAKTVTLSDLQGVAMPGKTFDLFTGLARELGNHIFMRLGYHGHHADPETGLANAEEALDAGIRILDGSLAGAGGCVTGAPGNLPTEDLVEIAEKHGFETGIDIEKVKVLAQRFYSRHINKSALG
ncbi:MAG: hypothetical protein GXP49_10190 [Deltaproteobacteria bacterium]|nr:hypothetical protein [Deltaproteobacteria bacterium]